MRRARARRQSNWKADDSCRARHQNCRSPNATYSNASVDSRITRIGAKQKTGAIPICTTSVAWAPARAGTRKNKETKTIGVRNHQRLFRRQRMLRTEHRPQHMFCFTTSSLYRPKLFRRKQAALLKWHALQPGQQFPLRAGLFAQTNP